jgi:N-acetylglutamate synthase-like GNAT family acetyltransferase
VVDDGVVVDVALDLGAVTLDQGAVFLKRLDQLQDATHVVGGGLAQLFELFIDHDGVIFACAALYPYPEAKTAEMAALTVSPQSQGQGDGEKVLKRIEQRARAMGLNSIFVLTTRTMHWFIKRGFAQVDPDWLPEARKRKYNWDRKSQVLVKKL